MGASEAIAYAQAQLGKKYVWATAGPKTFDCSGLTMQAWKAGGVSGVPHNAAAQYARFATGKGGRPLSQAQPGDLVFYGTPPHHVGLYIGGGQMIEAQQTGVPIKVSSIKRSGLLQTVAAFPGSAAGSAGGTTSSGDGILAFLKRAFPQFSNEADAAIIGNFTVESGLNPASYNKNENAHGFANWEGGRWSGDNGLQHYAQQHNLNPLSLDAETGFLGYELTHGYKSVAAALASPGKGVNTYTQIFQSKYEGSTPESLGARQDAAAAALSKINAGQSLGGDKTATLTSSDWWKGPLTAGDGGGVAGSLFSPLIDFLKSAGTNVAKWLTDGVLIVIGLVFVLLALVIVARSGGVDVTSPGKSKPLETPGEAVKNAAEGSSSDDSAQEEAGAE